MSRNKYLSLFGAGALALVLGGCRAGGDYQGIEFAPEMYHSIPYEPFTQIQDSVSPFRDKMNAQHLPEGVVAVDGHLPYDLPASYTKDSAEVKARKSPIPVTEASIANGGVLYERFCQVCHGKKGAGDGPVAKNAAINPPAFNNLTDGQIYHVIYYGQNMMGSYASQLEWEERWNVVHYIGRMQNDKYGTATVEETETPDDNEEAVVDGEADILPPPVEEIEEVEPVEEGDDHEEGHH